MKITDKEFEQINEIVCFPHQRKRLYFQPGDRVVKYNDGSCSKEEFVSGTVNTALVEVHLFREGYFLVDFDKPVQGLFGENIGSMYQKHSFYTLLKEEEFKYLSENPSFTKKWLDTFQHETEMHNSYFDAFKKLLLNQNNYK